MTSKVMDIFPPTLASASTIVSMATTVVLGLKNQMSRIQDGESIRMRRFKKQTNCFYNGKYVNRIYSRYLNISRAIMSFYVTVVPVVLGAVVSQLNGCKLYITLNQSSFDLHH